VLIKRGLGNEVFLKVKIWEIFTFRRRCSIDLLINVNLRLLIHVPREIPTSIVLASVFITRFIKPSLAFLNSSYRVPSVVAGAIVLSWTLHCALRESDGRIKDELK